VRRLIKAAALMPTIDTTEEEVDRLVAFVETLEAPPS